MKKADKELLIGLVDLLLYISSKEKRPFGEIVIELLSTHELCKRYFMEYDATKQAKIKGSTKKCGFSSGVLCR